MVPGYFSNEYGVRPYLKETREDKGIKVAFLDDKA